MRFKVVMCGRDCFMWVPGSLASVDAQDDTAFDVCVTDDASTDQRQPDFIRRFCEERPNWSCFLNEEPKGAMFNQVRAIRSMNCEPEDVIVIVDADDELAHPGVLSFLRSRYATGIKLTYGQYRSRPFSPTCTPAYAYPPDVIARNDYRAFINAGGGIRFNHLRTFRYELFEQLDDTDFQDPQGNWFTSCCDAAIMIPCLELARGNFEFIEEILYTYNSANPNSDWRRDPRGVDRNHDHILRVLKKKV